MKVSLDGGVTYVEAPEGVRVIHDGVMLDGEGGRGEIHFNHTHEGLITDVWTTTNEGEDYNIGTGAEDLDHIATRLIVLND